MVKRVVSQKKRVGPIQIGRDLEWTSYDDLVIPIAKRDRTVKGGGALSDPRYIQVFDPGASPCLTNDGDPGEILAEGDSWFCLSIYGNQVTMVQQLAKMGYGVTNVSRYSRTLAQVFARRNGPTGYLTQLSAKPKAFLLSAGGNDFLGQTILLWLEQRASGDHDPANAARYVNDNFDHILNSIEYTYKRIFDDVAAHSPRTHVVLQTYSYGATPTYNTGMHLGRYFKAKGFEPINPDHRALIDAIVKLLLDRFHGALSRAKRQASVPVEIVDFRQMLSAKDMRDEIHPKSAMAPRMAKAYVPSLTKAGIPVPP